MKKFVTSNYCYEYYHRPNENEPKSVQEKLLNDLSIVAKTCFTSIPDYQCFKSFKDKVIVLVKTAEGYPIAFASAVLLEVEGIGKMLHLGLVCNNPEYRNKNIMINIYTILTVLVYIKEFRLSKMWVSNCSCVLSVLKSVGRFYKEVYPSLKVQYNSITNEHIKIAKEISENMRREMFIADHIQFDPEKFIFKGSVGETIFRKKKNEDKSYDDEESFYISNIDFDRGDELLQIGFWDYEIFKKTYRSLFKRLLRQCKKEEKMLA